MIDLHSHILPELDDGARNLSESLAMARMAVESGVTRMVATPHCLEGRAREVLSAWQLLQEAISEARIPLKLYPGMEIFGTGDTVRLLKEEKLLTLNGSRYPLVEFDFHSDGEEETRILHSLVRAGYVPLVAHPERYSYIRQEPEMINEWKRMGCLFQVNRGSLLGRFGRGARAMAFELVERGFASVVASDGHSSRSRTTWLQDVKTMLTEEISGEAARCLLLRNPGSILKNEELIPVEPEWFR